MGDMMDGTAVQEPDRMAQRILGVAEAVGAFIEYWGFKAVHGRVWVLLALKGAPLPQTEIARLLGVSRSLMSATITELMQQGLVRAVGSHRNAPYEAVMDFWPTISGVLRTREWMLLETARVALDAAVEEAELARSRGRPLAWDLEQMRGLLRMTEMAQSFLKLIISLRMPRTLDSLAGWVKQAAQVVLGFGSSR
jgi:DNA-binding transcriptional regulator GbsR (MarR family)